LVKAVRYAETGHDIFCVKRQAISATVRAGLDKEQIPWAGATRAPAASGNGQVRNIRIKVGQPIVALRPWAWQVISKPQVQGQLIGYFPGISHIYGPIELLPCNGGRDIDSARCLVSQGGTYAQAKTQEEVGEIDPSTRRSGAPCSIFRPKTVEGNQAS